MNFTDERLAVQELRHAVASGRPREVAQAAMTNIWPLYSSAYDELTTAIESLPRALIERFPVLRVVHRMTPLLARTTRPFKPLVYPDETKAMSPDEVDVLTLVQMIAFRFSGDVVAALIYARRLDERLLRRRGDSEGDATGPLWFYHHQIGSTSLAAGNLLSAQHHFSEAQKRAATAPQPDAERMVLGRQALVQAVRGSLVDAEELLRAAMRQPAATPAHVASISLTERTAEALIRVERMDPEVDHLLAALEPYDSPELTWPFALLARTRALLMQDRPREALEAVRLSSDGHPAQHGSFALDVVNSTSIEALWALGDARAARDVATASAHPGPLTTFASIRLSLRESRVAAAEHSIRRLRDDDALGVAQRVELALFRAWMESAQSDAVSPDTAHSVLQCARDPAARRLLTGIPQHLIEQVHDRLSQTDADVFAQCTAGLIHHTSPFRPQLTTSELRVLSALSIHRTTAEIATAFHLSPNTVKSQLRSLYRKLGCSSRAEALQAAAELRLIAFEND